MRFRCGVWLDTHLAASGVCWKIGFLMLEDCSSFRCSLFTVGNCAVNGWHWSNHHSQTMPMHG